MIFITNYFKRRKLKKELRELHHSLKKNQTLIAETYTGTGCYNNVHKFIDDLKIESGTLENLIYDKQWRLDNNHY